MTSIHSFDAIVLWMSTPSEISILLYYNIVSNSSFGLKSLIQSHLIQSGKT